MREAEDKFDFLNARSNCQNRHNNLNYLFDKSTQTIESSADTTATEKRSSNNLLGKKRKLKRIFKKVKSSKKRVNKFKIEKVANLSITKKNNELPWNEIFEDDDDENLERLIIRHFLICQRRDMQSIDLEINSLKQRRRFLDITTRIGYDLLKNLPVEVSTEASAKG